MIRSGHGSYEESGSKLVQLEMYCWRTTPKAMHLARDDSDEDEAKWYPTSQLTTTQADKPGWFIVTMPEWLAKKNDL